MPPSVALHDCFVAWQFEATTPDGKNVYVADQDSANNAGFVRVIDTATNRIAATVKVQPNPFGIAVGPPR